MKKIVSFVCAIMLLACGTVNVGASAETAPVTQVVVSETVEYFEDGSYITTVITEEPVLTRASTYTKSGSKTDTYTDSDGDVQWKFTEKGTFSVETGVKATCTSASHTITIVDDSWENTAASSTKSSNKAIGSYTFKKYVLFVNTETVSDTTTLACSINGELS